MFEPTRQTSNFFMMLSCVPIGLPVQGTAGSTQMYQHDQLLPVTFKIAYCLNSLTLTSNGTFNEIVASLCDIKNVATSKVKP